MEKLEAYVVAETKYYDTVDAKRRKGLFDKVIKGWVSSEDIENSRILFHYPLYLSEDGKNKTAYVNKEDINIKVVDGIAVSLQEDSPENISYEEFEKSNLTEDEVEIYRENIDKNSTPIGGSYFDEPIKEETPVSFVKRTVKLRAGVTYDFNGQHIGHLPNEYYVEEERGNFMILRNKATSVLCKVIKANVIGY